MNWLLILASLFLGIFGGATLAIAPVLVWVAARDADSDDRPIGFSGTLLIFWLLMLMGGLMGFASIYLGGRTEWP